MHFMVEDVFNPETFQCAPSARPRSSSPYAIRQRDEIHCGAVNNVDEGRDFYGYPTHQTHRNTGAGGGATGYGRIPGSFILPSSQQPAQGNGGLPKEQQQRQQEQQQLRSHHHPDFDMRLVLERGACSHSTRQGEKEFLQAPPLLSVSALESLVRSINPLLLVTQKFGFRKHLSVVQQVGCCWTLDSVQFPKRLQQLVVCVVRRIKEMR